ncbi:MAG: ParM/StbA family protein [Candidatus Competibacteraceae bacterium]
MYCVGLDIGYSNVKIVSGDSGGAPCQQLYPAGAAPVDRLPEAIGRRDHAVQVPVNGEPYVALVEPARLQDWNRMLHVDYPATAAYQALYYAALRHSHRDTVELLITGLPAAPYWEAHGHHRDALRQRLLGVHAVGAGRTVTVTAVAVVPQPVGAYLDLAWRHDPAILAEARVLVLDPGFFSFDWVLIHRGEVRQRASGTSHQATSVLLEETDRRIQQAHGGRIGRERLEQALRAGETQAVLYGRRLELAPYLEAAAARTVEVALAALRDTLRHEAEADLVLLTGGGARFFEPATRELFPRSELVIPPEPVFANARGFWRYGGGQ